MIELIFVIVILGILAAVAIPKLAATRDDAKVSRELSNLATCINDVGAAYTATGTEDNSSASCGALVCFTVSTGSAPDDGNVTVSPISSANTACPSAVLDAAKTAAANNGLLNSGGTTKYHIFGGSSVTY